MVPHEESSHTLNMEKAGYVYIYLSNEEWTNSYDVFFDDFTVTHTHTPIVQKDDYYPFGLTFNSYTSGTKNNYLYNQGKLGKGEKQFKVERQEELGLDMTKYRMYDYALGRFTSVDPLADAAPQESWTPYQYAYNNPSTYNDPNGDCPWCLTAAVEVGGQIAANVVSGEDWNKIDYADVAVAAVEGGVIGLTGGLGVAGKLGQSTVKAINIGTKVAAAGTQGAIDVKTEANGGTQTVLGDKSLGDAAKDADYNLAGAALGGKAPTGSKNLKTPISTKTPSQAVKGARAKGPVNRSQRVKIQSDAKTMQKAASVANETIQKLPNGASGELIENVVESGIN